jgi:phospholipase C
MMMHRFVAVICCAALLAGCGGGAAVLSQPGTPAVVVTPSPAPQIAGSPIQHIIVVIQENRTMDNMFNGFPLADTVATGLNSENKKVALQPEGLEWPFDPDHTHASLVREYNDGAMNGFNKDTCDGDPLESVCEPPANFAYSYVPSGETTFLWILAGAFAGHGYEIADHMFSNRQVPTFPGHLGLIAGQGPADDPIGASTTGLAGIWGCDSDKSARVAAFGKTYDAPLQLVYPCFDYKTLGDLMDAKHVTWKYYTGTIGTVDGGTNIYDAIKHIRFGPDWNANVITPMTQVFDDLQNGTLPQVSFITPPFAASDHGGTLTSGGPAWVTSIYAFLTENKKLYPNTVMLVTWDDSGGWYDHVKPPDDAFGPLGFRVPLLALSPYSINGVNHDQHSFGSIVHFIEKNWNLGTLGEADASSDDLSDMFNYKQTPIPPVTNFGSFSRKQIERKYSPAYWRAGLGDTRPIDNE